MSVAFAFNFSNNAKLVTPVTLLLINGIFFLPDANVLDSIATWAIDVRYPYVSLALINNEIFGVPFYSNVGGIALLEWNAVPVVGIEETSITALQMYPNPVINTLHVILTSGAKYYLIKDISGRNIFEGTTNNNNIERNRRCKSST